MKRLAVELTPSDHISLKVTAARAGLTMREYVMELLRREGAIEADAI